MSSLRRRVLLAVGVTFCLMGVLFVATSFIAAEEQPRYTLMFVVGGLITVLGFLCLLSARKSLGVSSEERPKGEGSTFLQPMGMRPKGKLWIALLVPYLILLTVVVLGPAAQYVWNRWQFGQTSSPRPPLVQDMPQLSRSLSDPQLRIGTLLYLAEIGPDAKDAVPLVVQILDGKNSSLERAMAARTLGRIGADHPGTVPALCRALTDKDSDVQIMALETLTQMGPKANETLPVLERLKQHEDPLVAEAAIKAIAAVQMKKLRGIPAYAGPRRGQVQNSE